MVYIGLPQNLQKYFVISCPKADVFRHTYNMGVDHISIEVLHKKIAYITGATKLVGHYANTS